MRALPPTRSSRSLPRRPLILCRSAHNIDSTYDVLLDLHSSRRVEGAGPLKPWQPSPCVSLADCIGKMVPRPASHYARKDEWESRPSGCRSPSAFLAAGDFSICPRSRTRHASRGLFVGAVLAWLFWMAILVSPHPESLPSYEHGKRTPR